jgi:hypothetical protein
MNAQEYTYQPAVSARPTLLLLMAASEGAILAAPLRAKARMPDGGSGPPSGRRITQGTAERESELLGENELGWMEKPSASAERPNFVPENEARV